MIFTPLFAVMLVAAAVIYAVTGLGDAFDRDLLSVFDALLVVVLGLVLYGMSARDPSESPGWMDRIQLVAVVSALVLDLMVLGSMIARIGDLGFTPNRTAALGLNLVLLVNLAGAALAVRAVPHRAQQAPPARALADDLPARVRPLGRRGRGRPPAAVRLQLNFVVSHRRRPLNGSVTPRTILPCALTSWLSFLAMPTSTDLGVVRRSESFTRTRGEWSEVGRGFAVRSLPARQVFLRHVAR